MSNKYKCSLNRQWEAAYKYLFMNFTAFWSPKLSEGHKSPKRCFGLQIDVLFLDNLSALIKLIIKKI